MHDIHGGAADPRSRRFFLPTRVVWTSQTGVSGVERLLTHGDGSCILKREPGAEPPALMLDFGRELHGAARFETPITSSGQPVRVRVRFGESATEAMADPNQDHTIHDFETLLPWMGHQEVGNTGFRFVRLDLLEEGVEVTLRQVFAVFLFRDLPYLGSFECSDTRLNEIWATGAYTVHLCMQDHIWDGIKRDRLVWIGDMHPETMVVSTVFGGVDVIPASLDYVRDNTPLPGWMNGISSYSLWWILCQHDWFRYHGDRAYLQQQGPYLAELLRIVGSKVDPAGGEVLDGMRFLEWPTARDSTAIDAGLQALVVMALRAGASMCRVLGADAEADEAEAAATRAATVRRPPTASKQANALCVLAGMADPVSTNSEILAKDPERGISTFYGYYVLQARAAAGDYAGCLDLIRRYWGGMLDAGATTFWEHFELEWLDGAGRIDDLVPVGMKDIHADYGDHCFVGLRHSLCHGWAAGPTAWMTEHVLGLTPDAPGFDRATIRPNLGGLAWARGTIPTPHGLVRVEHTCTDGEIETVVEAPEGVEVIP